MGAKNKAKPSDDEALAEGMGIRLAALCKAAIQYHERTARTRHRRTIALAAACTSMEAAHAAARLLAGLCSRVVLRGAP